MHLFPDTPTVLDTHFHIYKLVRYAKTIHYGITEYSIIPISCWQLLSKRHKVIGQRRTSKPYCLQRSVKQQESFPVRCKPPACQRCLGGLVPWLGILVQWSSKSKLNKFEYVGGCPCMVMLSRVMVTWDPSWTDRQTDTYDSKHNLVINKPHTRQLQLCFDKSFRLNDTHVNANIKDTRHS